MARGGSRKIDDRIDLTPERIRRHHVGENSPRFIALSAYSDFFTLFENFDGYVDHFLMQDLVLSGGTVRFILPFAEF